ALVIKMSSHHGFMSLRNPLHFVGISENLPIDSFFNRNQIYSLPLLGILLLGAMYFTALTILQKNKGQTLLFLLMNLFVLGQLLSEMSRGLFNYAYPFHDLRLMAIVICALGFGWCLLIYVVKNVAKTQFFLWTSACVLLSLLIVVITPGFDVKTAGAILVPTLFASYLMLVQFYKYRDLSSFSQFAAFSVFSVTILLTLEAFHDLLFYYIITFMLCYLFIQQARNLVAEQAKRLEEQNQIAKLQFTLEQLEQEQAPSKLRLTSAGKVDVLDTNSIGYCKASGDYVEIYLLDGQCHLFSGSLKSLAVQLPSVFLKVHRSYVVNLDKVQSLRSAVTTLDNQASSNAYLLLKNQEKVPVSRRFMPMVRGKVC
ncbi:LytR/AlgR family response regulator transcription factor, partial [Paraglaciecola sp.]|uniref:LytR/AlgR family response regulator transcription factor n=1 Tax=Paraglaciecola sp. TaxID=1920173 RepID=UPI003EFA95CB